MRYRRSLFLIVALTIALASQAIPEIEHVTSLHLGSRYEHAAERDGYWYLVGQWGLECWRYDEGGHFFRLSEAATPGEAQWVAVDGDYAYVAEGFEGLSIVDIADPYNLRFVSNFMPWPISYNHYPGRFYYVAAKDGIAYLSGRYGVAVIDATDPEHPQQIDRLYFADTLGENSILDDNSTCLPLVDDSMLLVPFSGTPNIERYPWGLARYDVSDPSDISLDTLYEWEPSYQALLAKSDSLLLVASFSRFQVYTLSTEGALNRLDSLTDVIFNYGNPQSMSVVGRSVLIAGSGGSIQGGIVNIDITKPDSIVLVEDYRNPTNFNMVCFSDSVGIAGYFHWDLLHLKLNSEGYLDSIGFAPSDAGILSVAKHENILYVADTRHGVRLFDVTNPASPVEIDTLEADAVTTVRVFGNYLFAGTTEAELLAYDITQPQNPIFLDQRQIQGSSAQYYDFVLWNDLLFAGRQDDTLEIYDFGERQLDLYSEQRVLGVGELQIRDSVLYTGHDILQIAPDTSLMQLAEQGVFEYTFDAFDIVGDIYLAASGYNGLGIFDLSDLSAPRFITYWDTLNSADPPGDGLDVVYMDGCANLLDGYWGITRIDVSDPQNPFFIDRLPTPGSACYLTYDDQYLYIADLWGVEIMRYGAPVDVSESRDMPTGSSALLQNYPNPFNSTTVISYALERPGDVTIAIYNILGQRVRTLREGRQLAGGHQVTWDGRSRQGNEVASGVYFYKVRNSPASQTKKMILLR
jgi:hypothetical protein